MKYLLPIFFAALFASCRGKQETITRSQMKAKADSMVGVRMQEINRQAMEDLDRRMAIEVKAKADSIVQARACGQASPAITETAGAAANMPTGEP